MTMLINYRATVRRIDRVSMHLFVLLALVGLALCAVVIAAVNPDFAYRPGEIALAAGVSLAVCALVTYAIGFALRVPPSVESWAITGLIVFFLYQPITGSDAVWGLALAAALACASKYVLAVRGRHIINPAAAAAVIGYVLASYGVWKFAIAEWWIAAEPMRVPMIIIGICVVAKLRQWLMVGVFFLAAGGAALLTAGDTPPLERIDYAFTSVPTLFLGVFMLTEPLTAPTTRWPKVGYAVIVGVLLFGDFSIPVTDRYSIEPVPEIALTVGCLVAFLLSQRRRPRLTVQAVTPIGPGTYRVVADGPLRFRPGQWASLSAPRWRVDDPRGNRRVLSVAERPGADRVEFGFTTASTPSPFKAWLIESGPGARLYVDAVGGDFALPRTDRPVVLIAGGIGITPYRAMLADVLHRRPDRLASMSLLHAVNGPDGVLYSDVIEAAHEHGLRARTVTDRFLDDEDIAAVARPGAIYYASGPPAMIAAVRSALYRVEPALRWQRWRLRTDTFQGY